MSLQDTLDAFKADFETNIAPPAAVAVIHKTTNELIASGAADRALKAGDRAPDFALSDANGNVVRLSDLLASGPVAISFFRRVWCPYCNLELKALEETVSDIRARGATLIAVSPQGPQQSRKSQRDNGLSFPILSDSHNAIADAFGLKFKLQEDLVALYKSFGIDLSVSNGDDSWTLPMPGRFVIGTDGIIASAEVNADYTRRPDPSELLPVIDRLQRIDA